jgi:hypothetical protein
MAIAISSFIGEAISGNPSHCDIDYATEAFCSAHGSSCDDFCYSVPWCNDDAYSCSPLWWDPEYCVAAPEQDDWYCNCLCESS